MSDDNGELLGSGNNGELLDNDDDNNGELLDGDDGGDDGTGGELIDPGEPEIIVDEDGEIIINEWDGHAQTIQRTFAPSSDVDESSRSYTEISQGVLTFGYRSYNSGTRTAKYSITPATYTSGSSTYYGLACNAEKIIIASTYSEDDGLITRVGSNYPATGYLRVVTSITKSRLTNVRWVVEKLPFQNGVCVARRS